MIAINTARASSRSCSSLHVRALRSCRPQLINSRRFAGLHFRAAPAARTERGAVGNASLSVLRADPQALRVRRAGRGASRPELKLPTEPPAHPCAAINEIANVIHEFCGICAGTASLMPLAASFAPLSLMCGGCETERGHSPMSPESVHHAPDGCIPVR